MWCPDAASIAAVSAAEVANHAAAAAGLGGGSAGGANGRTSTVNGTVTVFGTVSRFVYGSVTAGSSPRSYK